MKKKTNKNMHTPRHKIIHNPIPTSFFQDHNIFMQAIGYQDVLVLFSLPNAVITNKHFLIRQGNGL